MSRSLKHIHRSPRRIHHERPSTPRQPDEGDHHDEEDQCDDDARHDQPGRAPALAALIPGKALVFCNSF